MSVANRLEQSYAALKEYFFPSRRAEGTVNPAQLVIFAEHATQNGSVSIGLECLELYHKLNPPENQFVIRAHLCEAVLIANSVPYLTVPKFGQSLDCILKAVSIASKSQCYHFLIYNASVLMWKICHHFQRPGYYRYFAKPLRVVVKALDTTTQDHSWKLDLLIGLILAQLDAGLKDEAAKTCLSAIQMAKKNVPERIGELVRIQATYNVGESKFELKHNPELTLIYKLSRAKHAIKSQGLRGPELEQKLTNIFKLVTKDKLSHRHGGSQTTAICQLVLELAFLSLENSLHDLARDCLHEVPKELVQDNQRLFLYRESLNHLLLAESKDEDIYSRAAVNARIHAVTQLEMVLTSGVRLGDAATIEHVSVILWNVSLPLLQPNLRHVLNRALTSLASALDSIQSLMYEMRLKVHFELAKISAQLNDLQIAQDNLTKALALDIDEIFSEELREYMLRYCLRSKIYSVPERDMDKATKIIEQCNSLKDEDLTDQIGPWLAKAGNLLAPTHFALALKGSPGTPLTNVTRESEANVSSPTPKVEEGEKKEEEEEEEERDEEEKALDTTMDPDLIDSLAEKGEKLQKYKMAVHHAQSYTAEFGISDANKRCQLWGDLAKIARKKGVWDVAAIAAIFCLQYDTDGLITQSKSDSSGPSLNPKQSNTFLNPTRQSGSGARSRKTSVYQTPQEFQIGIHLQQPPDEPQESLKKERDMVRMLAEVHCLLAECFVYQLQQEGLSLGRAPKASIFGAKNSPEVLNTEHWISYTEWCNTLTSETYSHFLRAAECGIFLKEQHLVSNAAIYLWNYNHHLIESNLLVQLIPTYRTLLASMRKMPDLNDRELMIRVCTALGGGITTKWLPVSKSSSSSPKQSAAVQRKSGRKSGTKKKGPGDFLHVDTEAIPELKEALEICDYAINVSDGVPMSMRRKLFSVWVQCKQLLQQTIPSKTFGLDELQITDGCIQCCRTVIALEMISRKNNKLWEFPSSPALQEVSSMLTECKWDDSLLEVELWITAAQMALDNKNYELVSQCSAKAMEIRERKAPTSPTSVPSLTRKQHHPPSKPLNPVFVLESELLSRASTLQGQSLVAISNGDMVVIRQALEAFLDSARFGFEAQNYDLVLRACSHYWNSSLPLSQDIMERELLREPFSDLLDMVASLLAQKEHSKSKSVFIPARKDLTLILSMYGLIFQVWIDKQAWEDGLKAVEMAIWIMPKVLQRDLAHYKIVFKSRLGCSVEGDMIKYQDEPELIVASLWYSAASNANNHADRLLAYQRAIESLKSELNLWKKVQYLLELSEWLYQYQFPVQYALDQLQLAVHTLLDIRNEREKGDRSMGGGEDTTPLPTRSYSSSVMLLEALLRVHVMMAQLQGKGSDDTHWDLCAAALAYCSKIWNLVYLTYSKSDTASKSTASKSTASHPPSTPEAWAEFQIPQELIDYLKGSGDVVGSLNKFTIPKPMLTLYYLDVLVELLCSSGLEPLTLPVLNLELAIVHSTLSNANSLCKLIHMRIIQVCLKARLFSGVSLHNGIVGPTVLDSDDLARSCVEIQAYKSKREAVAKEESRRTLKSARTVTFSKTSASQSIKLSEKTQLEQIHQYSVGEEVILREVWVKQAQMLISQGQWSSARELLNQAKTAAQCFDDQHTLLQVHINCGMLAVAEKKTEYAITSLAEALNLPCHLDTLIESVLLLSEAIIENSDYKIQHAAVLEHMMKLVAMVDTKYTNESQTVNKLVQILKSRMNLHTLTILTNETPQISNAKKTEARQLCASIIDSANVLLELGHFREAACSLNRFGIIYIKLSKKVDGIEHKEFILQALSSHQKAQNALKNCYVRATNYFPVLADIDLPLKTELVNSQLNIVEINLLVFEEYSADKKESLTLTQQKSSIQKMIDSFVRETPVLNLVEEKWISTTSLACDVTLNILVSAHSMAHNNPKLKAKCTYFLGLCFDLISKHASPDPQWRWDEITPVIKGPVKSNEDEGGDDGVVPEGIGNKYSALSMVVRKEEADAAEIQEGLSLQSMAQATHAFSDALGIAVANHHYELGMEAALKLVEIIGCYDPSVSSLYLAFYQSLAFSLEMTQFLCKLQNDMYSSQLGALLHQKNRLSTEMLRESPQFKANTDLLNNFEVYQSMKVSTNHLDYLKNYPPNFRFIVLQHSLDRSHLYGAYLIPPQPPPPSAKKGQVELEPLEAVINSAEVVPEEMSSLEALMSKCHACAYHTLVPRCEGGCEPLFTDIITSLDSYLSEVLKPITAALRKESKDKEFYVVLLADTQLMSLPLEALSFLQEDNICSVTRDFSLQMLQHRVAKKSPDGTASDPKDKKSKFQPPTSAIVANSTSFKYVLDPTNCIREKHPCSDVLTQIHHFPKITSKWTGFNSTNSTMSPNEWPVLLRECSGIVFFGTERLLAHLPPKVLVSLNLSGCSLAIVTDHMSTHQSIMQQSAIDLHKSEEELYFEQPVQTAMLLSMTGVGCVVANQLYMSVETNLRHTKVLLKGILSESTTVGKLRWHSRMVRNQGSSVELCDVSPCNSIIYNCAVYGLPHLALLS